MKFQFFHLFTAVLFVSILISSCKKEDDLNDPTVYSWKRELFIDGISKYSPFDNSSFFNTSKDLSNPNNSLSLGRNSSLALSRTPNYTRLIQTEYVSLTNAQVKAEKQKKESESNGVFFYKYTKVN
jgi:hypothetical protein